MAQNGEDPQLTEAAECVTGVTLSREEYARLGVLTQVALGWWMYDELARLRAHNAQLVGQAERLSVRLSEADRRIATLERQNARLMGEESVARPPAESWMDRNSADGPLTHAAPPPRVGEFVTCEAGHLICEVIGVACGAPPAVGKWRVDEHHRADCCPCGSHYGRPRRVDMRGREVSPAAFHIKGRGWV